MAITVQTKVVADTASAVSNIKDVARATDDSASKMSHSAATASTALDRQRKSTDKAAQGSKDAATAMGGLSDAGRGLGGALNEEIIGGFVSGVTGLGEESSVAIVSVLQMAVAAGLEAAGVDLMTIATKAWTFASGLATTAANALKIAWLAATGPIGLIVIAIIALIAIFVLLYTKVSWFRDGVNAVLHGIVAGFAWLVNMIRSHIMLILTIMFPVPMLILRFWSPIVGIVSGIFNSVVSVVRGVISSIVNLFAGVVDSIGRALSSLFDVIVAPFRAAWQWIQDHVLGPLKSAWNVIPDTLNGIGFTLHVPTNPVTKALHIDGQGFSWNMPNIPRLASGAVVDRATLALIGEGTGREIVTPESLLRSIVAEGGQAVNIKITVNVPPTANPAEVGRQTVKMLRAYVQANGAPALGRSLGLATS